MGKVRILASLALSALFVVACGEQGGKIVVEESDAPPAQSDEQPPEEEEQAVCPHVGDPLIDPAGFPECSNCSAGGAHCVPKSILPADKLDAFTDCDADNACVPDLIIATRGNYVPTTCDSIFGAEGRCLSRCFPGMDEKADTLPQSNCDAADVCVPCFDPFSGESTGACEQSCDPGPHEGPIELAACCSGDGICMPIESVGSKADDLGQDSCAQHQGSAVCVPVSFLEPGFKPASCIDGSVLGDAPGVCLPSCLPAVQGLLTGLLLDQEGCPQNHLCAPCDHPITGNSTGACDL
jgi:hypothetical protein